MQNSQVAKTKEHDFSLARANSEGMLFKTPSLIHRSHILCEVTVTSADNTGKDEEFTLGSLT